MKFTAPRERLLTACQLVAVAVAPRTTKPILSCIKAVASGDGVTLMASDLEVGVTFALADVSAVTPGAAILPATRLIAILRESADADITLDCDRDGTTIKTSTGRFKLPGGNPDEFPDIPPVEDDDAFEVGAGVLRTQIKRVAFAADKKESGARWAVTGVLVEPLDGRLRLVATDTRRLALMDGPATCTPGRSALVPQKAIQLLERSLVDDGEAVRVVLKPNEAMFQTGHVTLHTRLVEGRFPSYQDILPKRHSVSLTLPAADFLSRVRQAAIMADEQSKRVDIDLNPGAMTLQARGAELGESEVTLDLPEFAGPETPVAFDPQYLIDFLRAIDGEPAVRLEMTDGNRPVVFKVGESTVFLVMPLSRE